MTGSLAAIASLIFGAINSIEDKPIMVQDLNGHPGGKYAAWIQGSALVITLGISIGGGLITGGVLKLVEKILNKMEEKYRAEDGEQQQYAIVVKYC